MNSLLLCVTLLVAVCATLSAAYPQLQLVPLTEDQQFEESVFVPRVAAPVNDLESAATGHGHYGRVQIKVYRGPTTHGHHEHFAPHGFWVKQPADDDHHH
ncbi:uncharacterized protein [Anabrus simplex]|uniref:uncharacterized protein isoform X2 n=1 Tax=Anabrus simplex TaxID=316456 RepID=UPI0034DCCB75